MNLFTRFLRLFDFEYQVDFRSTIFELKLKIDAEEQRRYFVQNQSLAIPTAKFLINKLKNDFVTSEDVYDHIVEVVNNTLSEHNLNASFTPADIKHIKWHEVFQAVNNIKNYKTKEQAISKLRIYQTVSQIFGWG